MRDKEQPGYHDRITQDPEVMAGKPVVKGTRIPVETVLAYLSSNPNLDELFADYPRLTLKDVQACLEYANRLVKRARLRTTSAHIATRAPHL